MSTIRFTIAAEDLGTHNISGSHQSWKAKLEAVCRDVGHSVERLIHAAAHLLGRPDQARVMHNKIISKNKHVVHVDDDLRRVIAYLRSLLRRKEPLPIAA